MIYLQVKLTNSQVELFAHVKGFLSTFAGFEVSWVGTDRKCFRVFSDRVTNSKDDAAADIKDEILLDGLSASLENFFKIGGLETEILNINE